jgi:hypothetical protein
MHRDWNRERSFDRAICIDAERGVLFLGVSVDVFHS